LYSSVDSGCRREYSVAPCAGAWRLACGCIHGCYRSGLKRCCSDRVRVSPGQRAEGR
jgi:hypothetical protein